MDYALLSEQLLPLVEKAGRAIMAVRSGDTPPEIQTKPDHTPISAADLAAHTILTNGLREIYPEIPVLSEEGSAPPLAERKLWPALWLVDPLDGTYGFLKGGEDFCINIGLVENGKARFGLIYLPVSDTVYYGIVGANAWRQQGSARKKISCRTLTADNSVTIIASKSRYSKKLSDFEEQLASSFSEVRREGVSSAIKFCRIAEGKADIYPCFGATYEWDTAAGQALVEAAGGQMVDLQQQPFLYNRNESLLNGGFYVLGDSSFDWAPSLEGYE